MYREVQELISKMGDQLDGESGQAIEDPLLLPNLRQIILDNFVPCTIKSLLHPGVTRLVINAPDFILTLEEAGVLGEIGRKASGLRRLDFVSCQCPWLLAKALVEAMPQVEYIWEGGDEGVEKREDWIRRVDERRELYKTIW